MKIEFDPNKSEKNRLERDLPFELVKFIHWDTAIIVPDVRFDYPEPRYTATGFLGETERLHVVCFTPAQSGGIRVISFRKANKREVKKYEKTQTINK